MNCRPCLSRFGPSLYVRSRYAVFSQLPRFPTMTTNPEQSKGRDGAVSMLNITIEDLKLAKETSSFTPAKDAFGSAGGILVMIKVRTFLLSAAVSFSFTFSQDSMANEPDYIDLALSCAEVCDALDQGLKGRRFDELDQLVLRAIWQLTTYVEISTQTPGGALTDVMIEGLWPRWRGRSSR